MRLFREATDADETGLGLVVVPVSDADLASLGLAQAPVCGDCKGEKSVRPESASPHFDMGYRVPCPSCGGTGYQRLIPVDGIDVEELRDDRNALAYAIESDMKCDIQSPAFRRFVTLAGRVLAAIDQEDTP